MKILIEISCILMIQNNFCLLSLHNKYFACLNWLPQNYKLSETLWVPKFWWDSVRLDFYIQSKDTTNFENEELLSIILKTHSLCQFQMREYHSNKSTKLWTFKWVNDEDTSFLAIFLFLGQKNKIDQKMTQMAS